MMPKTPDEIKKALECCFNVTEQCGECPYYPVSCDKELVRDARVYIRQLEAELDAAVALIPRECKYCKHDEVYGCEYDCLAGPEGCHNGNTRWEWRGVQKEE